MKIFTQLFFLGLFHFVLVLDAEASAPAAQPLVKAASARMNTF